VGVCVGAAVGGTIAAVTGGNIWAGIAIGAGIGGLIGLGVGLAGSLLLGGSITASTTKVLAGLTSLVYSTKTFVIEGVKKLWQMAAVDRGSLIHDALGGNLGTFPVIDKFVKGIDGFAQSISSIKSIDVFASSYQATNALYNKIMQYGNELANFVQKTWYGINVITNSSTQRLLEIAVPANATAAQLTEINRAAAELLKKGVQVVIHFFE